jgi:hypothetical protein
MPVTIDRLRKGIHETIHEYYAQPVVNMIQSLTSPGPSYTTCPITLARFPPAYAFLAFFLGLTGS